MRRVIGGNTLPIFTNVSGARAMPGVFSDYNHDFARFLVEMGTDVAHPQCFVARNFLLDENVVAARATTYEAAGCVTAHAHAGMWQVAHEAYLTEKVFRHKLDGAKVISLDPGDAETCPETFQYIDPSSPFVHSDPKLDLVRVEEVRFVSRYSGVAEDRIEQLARHVVASGWAHDPEYEALSDVLAEWDANCETRPVFAAYWEDVDALFDPDDQPDWGDQLRDRLGLLHLDPQLRGGESIRIVAMRYPVEAVPKLRGAEGRPLVPPTVLDSRQSPAFCPAPSGLPTGYTVDLSQSDPPCFREVLHPPVRFEAKHIWRVGEIRNGVAGPALANARAWHIECLRDESARPDYASTTD